VKRERGERGKGTERGERTKTEEIGRETRDKKQEKDCWRENGRSSLGCHLCQHCPLGSMCLFLIRNEQTKTFKEFESGGSN
jgi:hypothetical protein